MFLPSSLIAPFYELSSELAASLACLLTIGSGFTFFRARWVQRTWIFYLVPDILG